MCFLQGFDFGASNDDDDDGAVSEIKQISVILFWNLKGTQCLCLCVAEARGGGRCLYKSLPLPKEIFLTNVREGRIISPFLIGLSGFA